MQTAQNWAYTRLTYEYPEEYRKFYLEEKQKLQSTGKATNSKAQYRAKARLVRKYFEAYRELYEKAAGLGFCRTHRHRHGSEISEVNG